MTRDGADAGQRRDERAGQRRLAQQQHRDAPAGWRGQAWRCRAGGRRCRPGWRTRRVRAAPGRAEQGRPPRAGPRWPETRPRPGTRPSRSTARAARPDPTGARSAASASDGARNRESRSWARRRRPGHGLTSAASLDPSALGACDDCSSGRLAESPRGLQRTCACCAESPSRCRGARTSCEPRGELAAAHRCARDAACSAAPASARPARTRRCARSSPTTPRQSSASAPGSRRRGSRSTPPGP